MSQRECLGFSRYAPPSIRALNGDGGSVPLRHTSLHCKSNESATPFAARAILTPLFLWSRARGVAKETRCTVVDNCLCNAPKFGFAAFFCLLRRSHFVGCVSDSFAFGVGHPIKPLSSMWRSDARSAQIGGPDFILQRFQVIAYSGEPFTSKAARNLFSKDDCRPALRDKAKKRWPNVSFVRFRLPLAGIAERLAGTTSRPHWFVSPSGEFKCVLPAPDPAEEMASAKPGNVCWFNLSDVSLINAGIGVKVSQPLGGERVVLVKVNSHPSVVARWGRGLILEI